MKKFLLCSGLLFLAYLIAASSGLLTPLSHAQGTLLVTTPTANLSGLGQAWNITSTGTLSVAQLDTILRGYGSPMSGLGQYIHDESIAHHIDADDAMGFWWYEGRLGTIGEARTTFSPGNLRCVSDRKCVDLDRGGYAQMNDWKDGIDYWFRLLDVGYVQGQVAGHPCTTLAEIVHVYAPSEDNNNEQAYVSAVLSAVARWRAGEVVLS
jgi:hypothetical protein